MRLCLISNSNGERKGLFGILREIGGYKDFSHGQMD